MIRISVTHFTDPAVTLRVLRAELVTAESAVAHPVGDGTLWLATGSPYAELLREGDLASAA